jgi:hypothetical protein
MRRLLGRDSGETERRLARGKLVDRLRGCAWIKSQVHRWHVMISSKEFDGEEKMPKLSLLCDIFIRRTRPFSVDRSRTTLRLNRTGGTRGS